ncbi:MAG: aminodeoxychorismate/anthranilate synthase component II [Lachnospiraceae bacterium]|nr:aminodeoxychorismate/anthranilate synthase component II [Lachnospiraceae bacterium]
MVLLIDNYDSFSYNVFQLVGSIREDIRVIRNDAMTVPEIEKEGFDHIILSPGPGYPKDAGVCEDVIRQLAGKVPMLGICLGHQAICEVFGATIVHAKELMHGKKSVTEIDNTSAIFKGLPDRLEVALDHSLAADPDTLPDTLQVLGKTGDGEIMAVKHREYDIYGLQFHPESILTQNGRTMMENFLA